MAKRAKATKTRKTGSPAKASKSRAARPAVKGPATRATKAKKKAAKAPAAKASAARGGAAKSAKGKPASRTVKAAKVAAAAATARIVAARKKLPSMSKGATRAAAITAGAIAATAAIATVVVKGKVPQKLAATKARRQEEIDFTPAPAEGTAESADDEPPRPAAARSDSARAPQRNLPAWMADHIERYLATNGADGHIWRGMPTLLLTTIGRRSGEPRLLPLLYGRDGDRYLVVGSRGGAADHPAWYKNLVSNPQVEVQVGADRFRGRARTANRDERPRLWRTMTKVFPLYDQYQARTAREIPVVVIERTS